MAHEAQLGRAVQLERADIVGMHRLNKLMADEESLALAEQPRECAIHLDDPPVLDGYERNADRRILERRAEALLRRTQLLLLAVQVHEHLHLRAQDHWVERLDHVVDG